MAICVGCKYYKTCGSSTRKEPCAGRETKGRKEKRNGLYNSARKRQG